MVKFVVRMEELSQRLEAKQKLYSNYGYKQQHDVQNVLCEMHQMLSRKNTVANDIQAKWNVVNKLDVGEWENRMLAKNKKSLEEFEQKSQEMTKDVEQVATEIHNLAEEKNNIDEILAKETKKKKEELEKSKQSSTENMRKAIEGHKLKVLKKLEETERYWGTLVTQSNINHQQWKIAPPQVKTSPSENVDITMTENIPKEPPGIFNGLIDTKPNHSFSDENCASTSSVPDEAASSKPVIEQQPTDIEIPGGNLTAGSLLEELAILVEESNSEVCKLQVESGDTLFNIRSKLNLTRDFRFLKPSGNPIAMKMEDKTHLGHGQRSIMIKYV